MYTNLFILIGLILLSGVFSGSETALISISDSKVDELVSKRVRNSKILKRLKKDPHKLLITILIGNNVVNIFAAAFAAVIFTEMFGSSGVGIATAVMTFFILVFGEITPKSFSHQHAVGVSLLMARPVLIMMFILYPFVWFFGIVVSFVNYMVGAKSQQTITEGEIVAMLKIGAKEGAIERQERELIENVLEFNDIEVEAVMTPRVVIEALDNKMTLGEAIEYAIKHSHSRLPVFDGSIDNIIGFISIKELLKYSDKHAYSKKLKNIELNHVLQVPYSKKINMLFKEFQRKHIHLAVVIDEHGGTAGLVTMEDLLEEIVGEIVDESDVAEKPIEIVNPNTIIVKGSTLMEDINDVFKIQFGKDEHDTLNSFVVDHLHRFPREGEVIKFTHGRVTVLDMKKNLIKKAKIQKIRKKTVKK